MAQRQLGHRPTESGGALLPEQAAYDVIWYDLDVTVLPQTRAIRGVLTVFARIVQPIEWFVQHLDTVFTVDSVIALREDARAERAAALSYRHTAGQLWSHLGHTRQPGQRVMLQINYHGRPRTAPAPPWVGGFTWAKTAGGENWIATSVQTDGADLWWPCKDHPSDEPDSMRIHITVPRPLVAVANGKFRGREAHPDSTWTYHWFVSTPINNYGVALNIAPYRTVDTTYQSISGTTIPVTFWALPESYEKARALMPQILEHLAWYEQLLGPYPFRKDKYGVAQTPFLGMEHQSIIAYGAHFRDEPHGYDILHHHELGHEWWGNMVTALDWRDFWLHEGLCSYMHPLYLEHKFGRAAYHNALAATRPRLRNRMALAPREARTTREMYFLPPDYTESEGDIFNKGVWVLHTLRYLIGDPAFFQALRRMAYPERAMEKISDGGQCRFATTDDLLWIAETVSGRDLDWFFEVYVRQPHLPRLEVHRTGDLLALSWQTPGNLPFPMPVDVEIGGQTERIELTNGRALITIPAQTEYRIDPQGWILKEWQHAQ